MASQERIGARDSTLITPSRRMLAFFSGYLHWYIGRHFHAMRLAHTRPLSQRARPADRLRQSRFVVGSALVHRASRVTFFPTPATMRPWTPLH